MEKSQTKELIELPDGGTAAFLNDALELTDQESATYVRVLYPDGRSVFGVKQEEPKP
jgi:hypothetical protein